MENTVEDLLTRRSYKKYPQRIDYPYIDRNLYQHALTDLETNAVCETNNRLFININEYMFVDCPYKYEVDITAERHGIWWILKAYSFTAEELTKNIEFVENELIKMFNSISNQKPTTGSGVFGGGITNRDEILS